jgi:hypothetical protein
MVTARARVSNASLRRVHFARTLALAATLLLLLPPLQAQARREAILRLREDVSTAMAHVSLNEKQIQKLDRCRQTLLVSAQAGRGRGTGNQKDMDATVKDIEKLFRGDIFLQEDRGTVLQDIQQLRNLERTQRARRR